MRRRRPRPPAVPRVTSNASGTPSRASPAGQQPLDARPGSLGQVATDLGLGGGEAGTAMQVDDPRPVPGRGGVWLVGAPRRTGAAALQRRILMATSPSSTGRVPSTLPPSSMLRVDFALRPPGSSAGRSRGRSGAGGGRAYSATSLTISGLVLETALLVGRGKSVVGPDGQHAAAGQGRYRERAVGPGGDRVNASRRTRGPRSHGDSTPRRSTPAGPGRVGLRDRR